MATLTLTLTGAGTLTPATRTISSTDLSTLQDAFTFILTQQGVVLPTTQQIFDEMAKELYVRLVDIVRHAERQRVASQVVDITLT